ncbi:hypothetical protein DCAR_0727652 [Daucus carota subsp. sativus]|uniref:Phosphate transporter n=1 Tax=Daucus carota subsp. sativus TaxID=79200 RepID=A0AAF0XI38_DAUCS|nr:hypothetical protein DCAR_0727652 [Daucus carota subsp. sativus]
MKPSLFFAPSAIFTPRLHLMKLSPSSNILFIGKVTSSWVISPLIGAAVSFLVYKCIGRINVLPSLLTDFYVYFVYSAQNPGQVAAAAAAPIGVFIAVTGISIVAFPLRKILSKAILQALALGTAGAFLFDRCIRKQLGFAAEFAAASVVLFASNLGLPISATHTLVGAVMGVGVARGLNSVRAETVKEIVTIPVGATFTIIYTWILNRLLSYVL